MIQYYQLTPEILLEYVYADDPRLNEDGIRGNEKDICMKEESTMLLTSTPFNTKYFCFKKEDENRFDSISNLVLPLNDSETQFVIAKSKYQNFFSKSNASNIYSTKNGGGYIYEDTNYDKDIINRGESCDVKFDKCIVHFTNRNYVGTYDSLIFQAYAYMPNKSKIYFASFLFKRTAKKELRAEHLLYNEKLYTTYIEFDIPSVFAIFSKNNDISSEDIGFSDVLKNQNVELLKNTPIGINVYGVNGSVTGADNYIRLKTSKVSSIFIPYIYNRLDEIYVNIYEATEENGGGDFYYIDPIMSPKYPSFVDYIESIGEDIKAYMIMHELSLKEVWVDGDGVTKSEITHKEYHIIDINEDDDNKKISERFEEKIKYRPICTKSGRDYTATIIDTIKIMNTVDSSSYEVTGSVDIANPSKYGKKLRSIDVANRPIVNVYNKKVTENSSSNNNLLPVNKSGRFVIENVTQNITSFIECTNVGVSIVELSPEDIN